MNIRKILVGAAVVVIGLPIILAVTAWVSFYAVVSSFAPNHTNGTLVSSGVNREYLLYVPKSYDRTKPTPLVISLHAAMNWPAFEMKLSGWNKVADANGFIVVYPAGTGTGFKTWYMEGADTPSRMPDVRFISALIDTLQAHYNIDSSRIYADGMSNGGGMAFALSCTLSSRIAAIGAVSAAQSLPWSWCADSTPVSMIAFHGTGDPIVAFKGAPPGAINPKPFPSIVTWVDNWARRNRCASSPVDSAVAADVILRKYSNCADDATVVLYSVRNGGHQWPGGTPMPKWMVGRATTSIDATNLMWAFFREHPLRTKQ
jgi:polyhydroxybutyrate depolymerase